jgi:hypothetical protein
MTIKKILLTIDDLLQEPHSLAPEFVDFLQSTKRFILREKKYFGLEGQDG